MVTVARYTSKEEAYVAKALLEAADIQAFFDDSRFSEQNTIEIRVPEAQVERARGILSDREEAIRGMNEAVMVEPKPSGKSEGKDVVLFLKGGALWIFGYVFLALLLRAFGVGLPFHPLVFGALFLFGGLIALTFGGVRRR